MGLDYGSTQQGTLKEDFEIFVCTCWCIWKNKNQIVHDGINVDPADTSFFATRYVREYHGAQYPVARPRPEPSANWSLPEEGFIKLNSDASIARDPNSARLGVITRNNNGDIFYGVGKEFMIRKTRKSQKLWQMFMLFD